MDDFIEGLREIVARLKVDAARLETRGHDELTMLIRRWIAEAENTYSFP